MESQATTMEQFTPSALFGDLPTVRIRCTARLGADARLPRYTGSSWRGLIGHQLQSLVCPFPRKKGCGACAIAKTCPYSLLFEEESTSEAVSEAPRGYVFYPEPSEENSQEQILHITLFGSCHKFLPALVAALFEGQRKGLGVGRWPYVLTSVEEILPDRIARPLKAAPDRPTEVMGPHPLRKWLETTSPPDGSLRIQIKSPLRLRKKGKYQGKMDWTFFFESLARRLESLNCLYHEGQPLGKELWLDLKKRLRCDGHIQENLKWWDFQRYSSRQKRKVPMGGLVGEAVQASPSPEQLQWWKAAEIVHVGKGAAMGLGKVEL